MDSRVEVELAHKLSGFSYVENVLPQKMLTVTLTAGSDSRAVHVRGVEGVSVFLRAKCACINGTAAERLTEANVGEMLARAFSISLGDEIDIVIKLLLGFSSLHDGHVGSFSDPNRNSGMRLPTGPVAYGSI